ncbi:glycosyltransferase family 39 protein [Micromonospora sp. CPCC 205371]|nr:glycosyltransferase family 39 protein [Micromonospora sp. CPCC 205371]
MTWRWGDLALVPLVAGATAQVFLWGHDRPLWLDEQMIAINLRDNGFRELTGSLMHHQSAPLGWLAVQRAIVLVLGTDERVLRLLPLVFGVATLAVVWLVARRWLGPVGAVAAGLLFGLAPALVRYAAELKQYSTDAFCALALLVLAAWVLDDQRRMPVWWVAAAAASWLSMDAILVTPGLAAVLVGTVLRRQGWRAALRASLLGLAWLAATALHYLVALRYTTGEPHLKPWWQARGGFPNGNLWSWLADRPAGLGVDPLSLPRGPVTTGFWVLVLAGLAMLLVRRTAIGLLLAAPLATAVVLGAAHTVPLASRLAIWLLPALFLAVAAAVEAIAALRGRALIPAIAALLVVAVGAWSAFPPQIRYAAHPPATVDGVDDRAAMAWIKAHRQPGDLVLVTISSIPGLRWYASMGELRPGWFVRAVTPGPACTPDELPQGLAGHRRVLAYSGIRTNPAAPAVLESRLAEQGQILERRQFHHGIVWVVELASTARPAAPTLPGQKTSCLQLAAFGNR